MHGNIKRCPQDPLCSRHALPHLHYGAVVQFPLGNRGQSFQPTLSLPSLPVDSEAQGHQSGRMAVLTSSSLESLLCLLVEAFLPLELRPLN